jgi:bifunctional non-homologous end joining protein LigD
VRSLGLEPLVKTTGGKGLHIVVPLVRRYSYEVVRDLARMIAYHVHQEAPALTTLEHTIAKRPKGTVYLDWAQIGEGKTVVAPFSVRARPKAPVSWPLRWAQVEAMARKRSPETTREMARWTIENVPRLLIRSGDPWAGRGWKKQRLESALREAHSSWLKM